MKKKVIDIIGPEDKSLKVLERTIDEELEFGDTLFMKKATKGGKESFVYFINYDPKKKNLIYGIEKMFGSPNYVNFADIRIVPISKISLLKKVDLYAALKDSK